jgi:hypothetical protein
MPTTPPPSSTSPTTGSDRNTEPGTLQELVNSRTSQVVPGDPPLLEQPGRLGASFGDGRKVGDPVQVRQRPAIQGVLQQAGSRYKVTAAELCLGLGAQCQETRQVKNTG